MMTIVPNSLVRQKEGAQGRRRKRWEVEEKEDQQELRRQVRTLLQVQLGKGWGYEEQEETWTVLWGSTPQEGQRGYELFLSSHDRNGGSHRRMNEVVKG